jgi:hypothetical protein
MLDHGQLVLQDPETGTFDHTLARTDGAEAG